MKLLAIEHFVVHRAECDALLNSRGFGDVGIDTRRGSHVDTLFTSDIGCVVHPDEVALFNLHGGAGGGEQTGKQRKNGGEKSHGGRPLGKQKDKRIGSTEVNYLQ